MISNSIRHSINISTRSKHSNRPHQRSIAKHSITMNGNTDSPKTIEFKEEHYKTYSAIAPENFQDEIKGKTVLITGGG
jgi:FlaA1/EpsC-like NDP-sugar epimerase